MNSIIRAMRAACKKAQATFIRVDRDAISPDRVIEAFDVTTKSGTTLYVDATLSHPSGKPSVFFRVNRGGWLSARQFGEVIAPTSRRVLPHESVMASALLYVQQWADGEGRFHLPRELTPAQLKTIQCDPRLDNAISLSSLETGRILPYGLDLLNELGVQLGTKMSHAITSTRANSGSKFSGSRTRFVTWPEARRFDGKTAIVVAEMHGTPNNLPWYTSKHPTGEIARRYEERILKPASIW